MPDHITTIDGPTPDATWTWRCLAAGCDAALHDGEQVSYVDVGDAIGLAGEHGNLDQQLDIVQVITTAVYLNGLPRVLAFYDDLIPRWEQKFPSKVGELRAQRAVFQARLDELVAVSRER